MPVPSSLDERGEKDLRHGLQTPGTGERVHETQDRIDTDRLHERFLQKRIVARIRAGGIGPCKDPE